MVNIETRQNGKFELGFPYNSTVDEYFKLLSEDFIINYGLSNIDVQKINDHKNATFHFDKELHEFVLKLSAFVKGFETEGQIIINEYDELKEKYTTLKEKVDKVSGNSTHSKNEYEYVSDNIDGMRSDLEKVNEMILFYQSQLIDETFVYTEEYIEDTENRLQTIDTVIETNNNEETHYENSIKLKIQDYVDEKVRIVEYGGFKETSLRAHYEAWLVRKETYYSVLVDYFKDEYESYWTYGSSLMYGQKLDEINAKEQVVKNVYELWKQTLVKKYEFQFEKLLRTYSLAWLQERTTFELLDFTSAVEFERKKLLELELPKIERLVADKTHALRSVVSYPKEQNYFRYIELVQLKRQHVYNNINDHISQDILDDYDRQMNDLESDYEYVKAKMNQRTYWEYYYDLERHQTLLDEVKRWYDIVLMAIARNFQKELGSNEETYKKIDFYSNEQKDIERKISELIILKDDLEIELNSTNDELTLAKSKMFEAQQLMGEKINEYGIYFTERIPFFTQNVGVTEKDGIANLLDGNFYRGLDDVFNDLKSYEHNVVWWNKGDKNKLFGYYETSLDRISKSLESEWEQEFGHEILSHKKFEYYTYYLEKFTTSIYAEIHKFVLDKEYNETILENVTVKLGNIRNKFVELVEFGFNTNQDVEFNPDIFDYEDKFKFLISEGLETKDDIIVTFDGFIENVKSYVYEKNMMYKKADSEVSDIEKIDSIWNDMEKKYV